MNKLILKFLIIKYDKADKNSNKYFILNIIKNVMIYI